VSPRLNEIFVRLSTKTSFRLYLCRLSAPIFPHVTRPTPDGPRRTDRRTPLAPDADGIDPPDRGPEETEPGYLGRLLFPPAGLRDRDPGEVLRATHVWTDLELVAAGSGLCPRCSATVETDLTARVDEGACHSTSDSGTAVLLSASCTNCPYDVGTTAAWGILSHPRLLSFLLDHGLNPFSTGSAERVDRLLSEYDEEVLSTAPLRAALTFSVDGDELRLCVDGNGDVVEEPP